MNLHDFDMNLLAIFDALWITRSVSGAAAQLHLTQSAVSAALNRLRGHLSDDLFVWNGRVMVATPRAETIAPLIHELLMQASLILDGETNPSTIKREFVVASIDYIGAFFGPALWRRIKKEAPNVTVDFVDARPYLRHKAGISEVDLFILPDGLLTVGVFDSQILYNDRYVCIASSKNTQISDPLDVTTFLTLDHVEFSAGSRVLQSHQSSFFGKHNIHQTNRFLTPYYSVVLAIVADSDCISIVPEHLAKFAVREMNITCFASPVATPDLSVAMSWHPKIGKEPAHVWLRNAFAEIATGIERGGPEL